MNARRRLILLVGLTGVVSVTAAAALASTVSWGSAIEVPGTAALNVGGNAGVAAISCPGAGTCTAGGYYEDNQGGSGLHPFVVDETGGTWGNAIEVPGAAALNADRDGSIVSISCPSAGNCGAGGYVTDGTANPHAFLVNETNGVWGDAAEVPNLNTLSGGSISQVNSISCPSAGNCAVGGIYYENGFHVFLASEKNGVWGKAIKMPGEGALKYTGGGTSLDSISCPSAGNCTAGGTLLTDHYRAYIVSEKNGAWSKAKIVPGTEALNAGGRAEVTAVSCKSATACTIGGTYLNSTHDYQSFVASTDSMGDWQKAKILPGTAAALQTSGFAILTSLTCASAGNCVAGGQFSAADGSQAFVARSKKGAWGKAAEVPGIGALDNNSDSETYSVSCASAGNCAATGYYNGAPYGFIVSETNGVWGTAVTLPGLDNLGYDNGSLFPLSCAKTGPCATGGTYYNGQTFQAFVTQP
jgi:hypothetical protein